MKRYLLVILFLSSCATNDFLYNDENGNAIYKANCGRWHNLDMGDCLKLAGNTCPTGFNILFANEQAIGVWSGSQNYGNINTNGNIYGNSRTTANTNIYGLGNNIFANTNGNTYSDNYIDVNTSLNYGGWGGSSYEYSRYIIYKCKISENNRK